MSYTATCPACGHPYPLPGPMAGKRLKCTNCGRAFVLGAEAQALSAAASRDPGSAAEQSATPLRHVPHYGAPAGSDAVATLIPYRNAPALISYYLGVFSLIPCIGAVLGVAAMVLGIMGLKQAARNPAAKGKVHAIVGIVCGGLFGLVWILLGILMLIPIIIAATSK